MIDGLLLANKKRSVIKYAHKYFLLHMFYYVLTKASQCHKGIFRKLDGYICLLFHMQISLMVMNVEAGSDPLIISSLDGRSHGVKIFTVYIKEGNSLLNTYRLLIWSHS